MEAILATRGFTGKRPAPATERRLPPGQSLTTGFPVLSLGPTRHIRQEDWSLRIKVRAKEVKRFSWEQFNSLPQTRMVADIHCVTAWSKLDTVWRGVTIDTIMTAVGIEVPSAYVLAHSADDYSTNVPFEDLVNGRGMVATSYDDKPLDAEHGGPARLIVPHLYFWKSAKWITGLQFTERDEPGFWESRGYHMRGDPMLEQRYSSR